MEEYKGIINELISKYYKEVLVINVFDDKIYKYNFDLPTGKPECFLCLNISF